MTLSPATSHPPVLHARNLRHGFAGTDVLHGVSLEVWPGEVVAVTGPSGSGKSTLLHLLGGLDIPQQGEVWWADERADTLDTQTRAQRRAGRVGLVFQHHYLLEDLSVLDNVLIPCRLAGQDHPGRARELIARVGLQGREASLPGVLSGGERQRVAVARALAARPAVVLADEPTGSLDRANAETVAALLVSLAREEGAGVLLVTHDDRLAAYADRTLHLLDGQFTDA
ncbi:putative Lipoprotein-releasing system ATP-binding protein lolD; putative ABC transporter, ATP-binding component [Deinococcus deserti VCD115]|uniref:Putative Lipoprotein-releasing system ATP-binding protein lolD putative ABC transporter, ATP-binding component n=1 Tax=Deinococcus deserti (strain DSM 17065 / CIP 109153 / LMG 22923 / VCD115) TaxID=546414 RepID=C1CUM7_DEIDV|nr:ATP-binding cassette domain-containing protein [Deinococcus deserti]ACO45894.2 putative Lipoprotein-releasing system ATP-binding protein lolD; putative ABC transporter, ATP-binding component [Deinococcus deserti VCD115]